MISVLETRNFRKNLKNLSNKHADIVGDEIYKIIHAPTLGAKKAGDLNYLRVQKFKLDNREVLLGYRWLEESAEIQLLHFGAHENFYKAAKKRRKVDFK